MTLLIVGGGKMGMSHLALCTAYIGKDNIALCDTKFLTRRFFSYLGFQTFSSVEKANAKLGKISGVVVATPTPSHATIGHWAIQRNIPVFIEKPLTLDVAASGSLNQAAALGGVPAQVGFVMRYVASFQRLRALVQEGSLGPVQSYAASMRGNVMTAAPPASSWQGNFSRGGGCLNEYGPHLIDLCLFIFGSIETINHADAVKVYSQSADDRISVSWLHENKNGRGPNHDILGEILIDWADAGKRKSVIEFTVEFEQAQLRVDNSTIEIRWRSDSTITNGERERVDTTAQPAKVGYYLRGEEFSLELESFLQTCGYGDQHVERTFAHETVADFCDGLKVDLLIDIIACKAGLK